MEKRILAATDMAHILLQKKKTIKEHFQLQPPATASYAFSRTLNKDVRLTKTVCHLDLF